VIAEARREEIRTLLMASGAVTVSELQSRFGISPMTVRRDLDVLEQRGSARRTHGGAVLPSVATPEDSFAKRLGVAAEAKQRLADAAFELLGEGETVFLDSSSTAYFLARRIASGGLTLRVLTNSGPAMQALMASENEQVQLYAIGGMERRLTGSFVGPSSVRMVRDHFVDRFFLSVTGIARHRILTDVDSLEAAVKRAMLEQARETVLLMDDSKLTTHGGHAIAPLKDVSLVLADGLSAEEAERLRANDVDVHLVGPR
jgi:DeoR/GlpR family transcriptional regulator of sugar metabolism